MNIGDGLTLQTRTINGKPSTGIFLVNPNISKNTKPKFSYKTKTVRYPIRGKNLENVLDKEKPKNISNINKLEVTGPTKPSNTRSNATQKDSTKGKEIKTNNNDPTKKLTAAENNKVSKQSKKTDRNSDIKIKNDENITLKYGNKSGVKTENKRDDKTEKAVRKTETIKKSSVKPPKNKSKVNDTTKPLIDSKKETGTNPKYITLTQDQLNTILSLVKTKHEIDVGNVVSDSDSEDKKNESNTPSGEEEGSKSDNSDAETDDDIVTVRPTSVPGLDLSSGDEKSNKVNDKQKRKQNRPDSSKNKKSPDEKPTAKEETENTGTTKKNEENSESILDMQWGVLGGFGSREKEKIRLAEQKKQWIKELDDQVNRNKRIKEEELLQKRGLKSLSSIDVTKEKKEDVENITDLVEENKKRTKDKKSKKPNRSRDKDDKKSKEETKSAPPSAKNKSKSVEILRVNPENLPAAIRSSFYPGESAPRDHAFSASKQEQQRRWRMELDKQREEQQNRRQIEKNRRLLEDDDGLWARHFDTMQPKKSLEVSSPRQSSERNKEVETNEANTNLKDTISTAVPLPSARLSDPNLTTVEDKINEPTTASHAGTLSGLYNKESTGVRDPNKSTYLRTMTSLLDPAQLEANEVRRKRQEEHRNAIAAQVEEQRKRKEAEDNKERMHDQIEEERLKQERLRLDQQFEIEKLRQKMQESKREEHTRKLFDQLQQAEAEALRDKLKQREKFLRARGHDTSLLEQTHNTALLSHRPTEPPRNQPINIDHPPQRSQVPINSNSTNSLQLSQDLEPISLTANTEHGPIELKISLNNLGSSTRNGVETGMQTMPMQNTETQMSDAETEYLSLPPKRKEKQRDKDKKSNPSLKKYEENLNKQYNKYSRKDQQPKQQKTKSDEAKPKWGVGAQKNKKFVPASQRYVKSMKWQEKHEQNVKRREEQLLAQQAMNDREHLQAISRARMEDDDAPRSHRRPTSPVIPALARKMEDEREKRRHRSTSPNKATSKHKVPQDRSLSPYGDKQEISPRHHVKQHHEATVSRPYTVISVTTENAKYRPGKHSRDSPVPHSSDFVQYRRTADILGPSNDQEHERVTTSEVEHRRQIIEPSHNTIKQNSQHKDPLTNPNMVKQRERQDQILHEIAILRQGLMLKQREVASYPVAIPTEQHRFYQADNLPERTNDTPHGQ